MSHSGKTSIEGGVNTLADRFKKSLKYDHKRNDDENNGDVNKPDFKELDLGSGSPVSTLRPRPNVVATSSRSSSSSSSSSGSFSGRNDQNPVAKKSDSGSTTTNSGELSGSGHNSPTFSGRVKKQPVTRVSDSGGSHLIYSGGGSVSSPPAVNALPAGNICPLGKILKADVSVGRSSRPDVLGTGRGHYGHGSIMRGGGSVKFDGGSGGGGGGGGVGKLRAGELGGKGGMCGDGEEMKRLGNEEYKKGHFSEALSLYDRAIAISPENAAYHYNKAAALIGLNRLGMAVRECEEVLRLDPGYVRAHHRLGSLYLCLGQVENARRHICFTGIQPDPVELQKLQAVEKHLAKCSSSRRIGDWKVVLREADAAVASGADASPQLFACRAEALLKLQQYADAELSISSGPRVGTSPLSCSQTKVFGMLSEAYILLVRSQIDMSMGRFDSAVTYVEKAAQIDPQSAEISALLINVKAVARARTRGNDLFKSERFTEASAAYGEGLRLNPSSSVLYCNRAACWYKLGQWERSLEDCNKALDIQPNYTKALLRRAASNSKLERWVEAVRDYEVLRKELPNDNDVAEALFHAQVGLRKSRGEEVHNMKFGGDVELVSGLEQFRAAISSPNASVVHFKSASDLQCNQISPFVDSLCSRYPSINFLKVDVRDSPGIANAENVKLVPTFKIYKNGSRLKEMICPSPEVLESSVRHYSF